MGRGTKPTKRKRGGGSVGANASHNCRKRLKADEASTLEKATEETPQPSTSSGNVSKEDTEVRTETVNATTTGCDTSSNNSVMMTATNDNNEQLFQVNGNSRLFTLEHPMLNPMLVMKIMDHYKPGLEDFKIVRQVCKCWYDVTFDLWRKNFVLRLTNEKDAFQKKKRPGLSVGEFFKRFEDPEDPFLLESQPYSKYTFSQLTIDMSLSEKQASECKRFWDGVGPFIKHLHFDRCFFPSGQYMAFEEIVFEKVPNLKTLAVTDTGKITLPSLTSETPFSQRRRAVNRMRAMKEKQYNDHLNVTSLWIYGGIPVKLKKLVSQLPNLEDLRIRNSVQTSASYDHSIMELLIFIRRQRLQSRRVKYNLKTLELMHTKAFYSSFSVSRVLNEVQFPLTNLSVEIKPNQSLNHQALKPLLEHHASTLKILKVFCPPLANTVHHDTFPFDITLECLEEMELWGNVSRSLKFLKFMPNLTRLLINRCCIEKWEEISMQQKEVNPFGWFHPNHQKTIVPFANDMIQKTLQECDMTLVAANSLEMIQIDYEFCEGSLRQLKEWAPNLKTLWTILNKESLSAVSKLWPDITYLRAMYKSDLDDGAITGWTFDKDEPKERIPGACLIDLKNLRKFQLDTLCSQSKLTDRCVEHGFLKMGRLDAIQICVSTKFKASMEEKLRKHIPFVRVIRNYGRKHSLANGDADNEKSRVEMCCLHKKFFEQLQADREAYENDLEVARRREVNHQNGEDSSDSDGEDVRHFPRRRFNRPLIEFI